MIAYQNKGQNSGITAYEIGADFIRVEFTNGAVYEYSNDHTGASKVEHMKYLAEQGKGLNSYLNREVHQKYVRKLR